MGVSEGRCFVLSEHSEHYIRCKARRMWTRRSVGLWPDAKWLGLEEEKNKKKLFLKVTSTVQCGDRQDLYELRGR